jgi:hypothetical protein
MPVLWRYAIFFQTLCLSFSLVFLARCSFSGGDVGDGSGLVTVILAVRRGSKGLNGNFEITLEPLANIFCLGMNLREVFNFLKFIKKKSAKILRNNYDLANVLKFPI